MNKANSNISAVIELSRKLMFCADKGDLQRSDDSCGVLFAIVRDCAYKMMDAAETERQRHIERGIWDFGDPPEKNQL